MSEATICNVCDERVGRKEVFYSIERRDQFGYADNLDACSPECLAVLAVGEGHERGDRAGFSRRPKPVTEPRKWWNR